MRLIDADSLKAKIIGEPPETHYPSWYAAMVDAEPDAQPERKKEKWIYGEDKYGIDGYHCDKCGFFVSWDYAHKFIDFIKDYHFCPNCGAKMEEGVEND